MLSISQRFSIGFVCFVILTILTTVILLFFNSTKPKTNSIENYIILGLTSITLIFFYFPATTSIYTIIFNFVLIGIALILLYIGYQKEDINIVNIGMSWISIFILVRYFDFFWELLPRSLFFMVGGLILILGGLALERKLRELK